MVLFYTFTPAVFNCNTVDMLVNIVGHKIDANYETWTYLGQKRRGDRLDPGRGRLSHTLGKDGFLGGDKMMHILYIFHNFIKSC